MKQKQEITEGAIVSVPFGNKYLQGTVEEINPENIAINHYVHGIISVPNNDSVYAFFPGQKFDMRELDSIDTNSENGHTLREKIDAFLSRTEIGSFDALIKNDPKEVGRLLTGKLTSNLYEGASLVQDEKTGNKAIKNWAAKFQLYRGRDKNLKLDVKFQAQKLDLKVYGVEISEDQRANMMDKNRSVTLERKSGEGRDFKVFARYDKDLNSIVTSPYSEKVEKIMKQSYAKRDAEGQSQSKAKKEPTVKAKATNAQKTEERQENKRQRGKKVG